jgi:hypothetical protein
MSRRVSLVIAAVLMAGFLYAAPATALRYAALVTSDFVAHDASSIDTFLGPAQITSAQLRGAAKIAGWREGDEVVVVADRAISREQLYQVYYSAGYVLYPIKVRLAGRASSPSRLLVLGPHRFSHANVNQLSAMAALVTLP